MQVQADWSRLYTPQAAEKELQDFEFKGPGLYLTKTDTLLVIPQPPNKAPTAENIWYIKQPEGTLYRFYVYNVPFEKTIFAAIAVAPARVDERG